MSYDVILLLLSCGLGILIGMNITHQKNKEIEDKTNEKHLEFENKKLKEENEVLTNLRDSLLEDVRYWRDKARK